MAGFIKKNDIPAQIRKRVGNSNSDIINYLVNDLVANSTEEAIAVSEEAHQLMLSLIQFNYENIYKHPIQIEVESSCDRIVSTIFEHLMGLCKMFDWSSCRYKGKRMRVIDSYFADYLKNMSKFYLDEAHRNGWTEEQMEMQVVTDYLSGMTDRFALECMREIALPRVIRFQHGKGEF